MKEPLYIVKIGGNIIDEPNNLSVFLDDFITLPGKKILVHGGGKIASRIGTQLGLEPQYVDGRRITDSATLDLVTMVYGGLLNKQIIAALQARGCNALGVTGADGNIMAAHRRPIKEVDYGWVGDPDAATVNTSLVSSILGHDCCLVMAPLTHDSEGNMLNTNADTIAAALAQAMAPFFETKLIYCFEVDGVLEKNNRDQMEIVPVLTASKALGLREKGDLSGGIFPKIENALAAAAAGAALVWIGNARQISHFVHSDIVYGTLVIAE